MNLYNYFETKQRDNGETFVCLKDNRPQWLQDAVREAHDDEFPNDWRYAMCRQIAGAIDDGLTEDYTSEFADGAVDIYNSDRVRWLADDHTRTAYVDEARNEGLMNFEADILEQIGVGQYVCIERMASVMFTAWLENQDGDDLSQP